MITDPAAGRGDALARAAAAAIRGGADVIQLRDKAASDEELERAARALLAVTRAAGVPLVVNDRIEVARRSGADGLHLGQDDAPFSEARRILGERAIVGRSTHSPEQALAAVAEGFDYIGVGPVFSTPTKPSYIPGGLDLVRFAAQNVPIPFVAIGGIDASNVGRVTEAGARCVAVVRAVMASPDPQTTARELSDRMRSRVS